MTIHPRPLLERAEWTDLNGDWQLEFDDSDVGVDDRWWVGDREFGRAIVVPFPPESTRSGVGEDGHSTVWYRRHADLARPTDGRRVILHFDAIDWESDVWINGIHVARHEGGHVGFAADVTHALEPSRSQVIVVRAFDSVASLEQPRGKQDWEPEPHVIWYRRTTGIWRSVWAEVVGRTHLTSLDWTTCASPGELAVESRLNAATDAMLDLEFVIEGRVIHRASHSFVDGQLAATLRLNDVRFSSEPERLLWSPENPLLIDVRASVRVDSVVVDTVSSYVGLRTVGTDDDHFVLNGRPYFLRLVLEQAYWPDTHLASPSDAALRSEVELIKQLGFNGVRMHQTTADPRFLYWCDRLGLLVWADAPASYRFSALSLTRTVREWMEILARDSSHPSIVAWVAFNESWGVPEVASSGRQRDAVRALFHLLKSVDPTRPVIGNDGWEFVAGDMLGVHDYTQSAELLRERYSTREAASATVVMSRPGNRRLTLASDRSPHVPIVLSEFGGVALSARDDTWSGYGTVDDHSEFLERLAGLIGVVNNASGLAGFCYTQLTDTLQERNGLLTEGREFKADPEIIAATVSGRSISS